MRPIDREVTMQGTGFPATVATRYSLATGFSYYVQLFSWQSGKIKSLDEANALAANLAGAYNDADLRLLNKLKEEYR